MDAQFWNDRWQRSDIGFHQKSVHDLLMKYWPDLNLRRGSQVFVPCCGKSLDMVWLAEQGHSVLGVELSELAVDSFFDERSRRPATQAVGTFAAKRAGPYELWCGDYFDLAPDVTRHIAAVFDRASLVAMPWSRQRDYADKLAALTPSGVPMLLISLAYDPSQMEGPPFSVPQRQVESLFDQHFHLTRLEARDGLAASDNLRKRGLTQLEEAAYLLKRR
jgi:thiopurine S-methyltransferase